MILNNLLEELSYALVCLSQFLNDHHQVREGQVSHFFLRCDGIEELPKVVEEIIHLFCHRLSELLAFLDKACHLRVPLRG